MKDPPRCNLSERFSINHNNTAAPVQYALKVATQNKKTVQSRLHLLGHVLINGGRVIDVLTTTVHPSCKVYQKKTSLVCQSFILAAAACTYIKLQLQMNLAGILSRNESCSDENNVCTNSPWPGARSEFASSLPKAGEMQTGVSDVWHFEAVVNGTQRWPLNSKRRAARWQVHASFCV